MTTFEIRHRLTEKVLYSGEGENLREVIEKAVSEEANLQGANLQKADLWRANLQVANLQGANLQKADLWRANLQVANLRGANLRGANLQKADLWRANLQGANLQGADLRGADLRGANLQGANLRGTSGINKYLSTPLIMLLDQPGKIRAYKLVNSKDEGPYNGGIKYITGQSVEELNANTDDTELREAGINVATLDWCMNEWQSDYKIKMIEFEAKDIAAIPIATDGKFRLFRCDVLEDVDLEKIGLVKKEGETEK
jgi:uncharacterized protein YjbI with pentapeptide repeats